MSRRLIVAGVVVVLALAGLGVGVAWRDGPTPCGAGVTTTRDGVVSPLAQDDAPPRLVEAVARVGEVVGSVGYDYRPVQLSAYAVGLGVRVVDDPRLTLLDDATGAPRWSIAVGTQQSTFDADDDSYVVVTLPGDAPPDVVAHDLATGERRWCATLDGEAAGTVSTALQPDGSVVVLRSGDEGARLTRVGAEAETWETSPQAGAGDYLGPLDDARLLLGGSALPDLLDPGALEALPAGDRLVAVAVADGASSWTLEQPAGTDVHVVGVTDDRVLLTRAVAGEGQPGLVALDLEGREVWSATPSRGTAFDATVRGDRVVVRAGSRWAAYDTRDGSPLWDFEVPRSPQFLPYGATLASMPSLDADTLLVGSTEALVSLDLATGARTSTPLPTDGLATTYWPQRVVASPSLIGVVTNTGTVVVRRPRM